jgi:hypothetical protein
MDTNRVSVQQHWESAGRGRSIPSSIFILLVCMVVVGFLFILNEFVTTAAGLGDPHTLANPGQTGHAVDAEVAAEAVAEAAWRTTPWNSDAEFAALK